MPKVTLTATIATQFEALWQLGNEDVLPDVEICQRLGIPFGKLRGWLQRNTKVIREDGTREGLREIRARARGVPASNYLQLLYSLSMEARAAGDLRTASENIKWLMERMYPHRWGRLVKERLEDSDGYGVLKVEAKLDNKAWLKISEQVHEAQKKLPPIK